MYFKTEYVRNIPPQENVYMKCVIVTLYADQFYSLSNTTVFCLCPDIDRMLDLRIWNVYHVSNNRNLFK